MDGGTPVQCFIPEVLIIELSVSSPGERLHQMQARASHACDSYSP